MRRSLVVLAIALALPACHRKRGGSHHAPATRASSAALAADAGPSGARPFEGPASLPPRQLSLGVFTSEPVPPTAVQDVQKKVKQRAHGLALLTDATSEAPLGTGFVRVFAPSVADFPPPSAQQLQLVGHGLDAQQVQGAAASKGVVVFGWALLGDPSFAALRDADAIAADLADASHGFVWDDVTRELFAPGLWRARRVEGWQGDVPDVRHHIAIHYYDSAGGRHRAITLGMGAFGLPDLVVQDVPGERSDAVFLLVDALAQELVEGAAPDAKGEIAIDLATIKHDAARKAFTDAASSSAGRRASVTLLHAKHEEGDPDNRLAALTFPAYSGATELERQAAATTALFGGQGGAGGPKESLSGAAADDPDLAKIKARVQERLPAVGAAFKRGLPLGERVSVEAPFPTDRGTVEWMWVTVTRWDADSVHGMLNNTPALVPSLHRGDDVDVKLTSIADYTWLAPDGSVKEGGESVTLLHQRQAAAAAAAAAQAPPAR